MRASTLLLLVFSAVAGAAEPVKEPNPAVDFRPAKDMDTEGRTTRATVGVIGMGIGYATALVQDIWFIVELTRACAAENTISVACGIAAGTGVGLVSLSLIPVAGPAVLGWALDTGAGPYKPDPPTWGHRVVGFTAAAIQLAAVFFLVSAVDTPGPQGFTFFALPTNDGAVATASFRF